MNDTILLTGAASGITRATARLFHRHGWRLALLDQDTAALQEVAAELRDADGRPAWHQAVDVTDNDAVVAAVNAAGEALGTLRVLFNGAGILRVGPFEDIPLAVHRRLIDINVIGLMQVTLAALPWLQRAERPVVVNMSSASAVYGIPHFASYSASKFAVRALTESLQIEWERHGIHVCDIMPPFVRTPMVDEQSWQPPVIRRLGVNLEAEDVAAAAFEAVRSAKVHHPVSTPFKALVWMEKLAPRDITRRMIRWLSRD